MYGKIKIIIHHTRICWSIMYLICLSVSPTAFLFCSAFLETGQQNFKKLLRLKGVILRVCTYLWETLVPLFCREFSILKCFAIHEYTTETIKFHHNSSFDWIIFSKNNAPFISYFLYHVIGTLPLNMCINSIELNLLW